MRLGNEAKALVTLADAAVSEAQCASIAAAGDPAWSDEAPELSAA